MRQPNPIVLDLANDGAPREMEVTIANAPEYTVDKDGWALLAPYGDSRYSFRENGKVVSIVQRITKAAAESMVNSFNGIVGSIKRFFRGAPIFHGHPDDPRSGRNYPDKEQKGLFNELQAREDGLYVKPLFNDAGAKLIEGANKLYFSGRWTAQATGEKDGLAVFEPFKMLSIGLTRNPNLPTELLNDSDIMERTKLIAGLALLGITLANDAGDDVIDAAIKARAVTLTNEKTEAEKAKAAADAAVAAEKLKVTTAEATLANERTATIKAALDTGVKVGAITEADRPIWQKRLEVNFANELPVLSALPPKIKTEANPAANGSRQRNPPGASAAAEQIRSLANAKMPGLIVSNPQMTRGEVYIMAYNEVLAANPALKVAAEQTV